jgi:ribonuclease P protein component
MKIETLKRPAEFKRVRGGARWATPLFVIEGRKRVTPAGEGAPSASGARFGFTITRKVGSAVVRNRIRRRLKEALRTLEAAEIRADHDYVVVASRAVHDYPFAGLQDAFREAFERLHRQGGTRSGGRGSRRVKEPEVTPAAGGPGGAGSGTGKGPETQSASGPDTPAARAQLGRQGRRNRR